MTKLIFPLLLVFAVVLTAFAPPPHTAKIDSHLRDTFRQNGSAEFLVVLNARADLSGAERFSTKAGKGYAVRDALWNTAQISQQSLRAWLNARGVAYRPFYIVNAIWVEGDAALANAIAQRADVLRLEANPKIKNKMPAPVLFPLAELMRTAGIEPGVSYINAPAVWAMGFIGQGIVIGAQDTGYDWTHLAIKNRYRGWDGTSANHDYNWHDSIHSNTHGANICGTDSPVPCDDHGHGTHTIGTAVGDDGAGNQIGVAPGAQWIGCRNMDNGWGTPASYLECFEFFLAPYPVNGTPADGNPALAPDVTTNSWSCPSEEGCGWTTLQSAVEAQRAAGIMTVVAAGNSGPGCSTIADPPAIYDAAYTVGALNTGSDTLASFSSRGPVTVDGSNRPKPDIAAPGTNTRSSYPGGGYATMSGTSMATPHVAGAVALLWSAVPTLTHNITATEAYLNAGAQQIIGNDCGMNFWANNMYGHGRLDVRRTITRTSYPIAGWEYQEITPMTFVFTNTSFSTNEFTSTWDFGDGTSLINTGTILMPVQHTYTQSGLYNVVLTVQNQFGYDYTKQLIYTTPYRYYLPLVIK